MQPCVQTPDRVAGLGVTCITPLVIEYGAFSCASASGVMCVAIAGAAATVSAVTVRTASPSIRPSPGNLSDEFTGRASPYLIAGSGRPNVGGRGTGPTSSQRVASRLAGLAVADVPCDRTEAGARHTAQRQGEAGIHPPATTLAEQDDLPVPPEPAPL
jgi:hypothetical protein